MGSELVLLVEDNSVVRGLVRKALSRHGVPGGRSRLGEPGADPRGDRARAHHNLILSDVVMPGMQGPESCRGPAQADKAAEQGSVHARLPGRRVHQGTGGRRPAAEWLQPFTTGRLLQRVGNCSASPASRELLRASRSGQHRGRGQIEDAWPRRRTEASSRKAPRPARSGTSASRPAVCMGDPEADQEDRAWSLARAAWW